jgi:hypothetical protein
MPLTDRVGEEETNWRYNLAVEQIFIFLNSTQPWQIAWN